MHNFFEQSYLQKAVINLYQMGNYIDINHYLDKGIVPEDVT